MKKILIASLKSAAGIAVGTTIGGCLLPRLFFGNLCNETWPPIWKQAVIYFLVGYLAAFLVFFLINLIKTKAHR
ncbi:MAG: hypothetical protein PHD32_01220 [Eubacteriales bacterium]|nr:hypothetical protein [Eubacteriales bacterium]